MWAQVWAIVDELEATRMCAGDPFEDVVEPVTLRNTLGVF